MNTKKWFAVGALSLTALLSGCVTTRGSQTDENRGLRAYAQQNYRGANPKFQQCPNYVISPYCGKK